MLNKFLKIVKLSVVILLYIGFCFINNNMPQNLYKINFEFNIICDIYQLIMNI